jgi:NTE family protein
MRHLRFRRRRKVGLVLGSGGARGWAHIGVIAALREADIEIECIAGTSIGALVGGALAAGRIDELRDFALRIDWRQLVYYFLDVSFPRSGLVDGKKIEDLIRKYAGERRVESLPVPFAAVAADVLTGREIVEREGDLIENIRASIAVPGIFTPVLRGSMVLVDGGIVNPVPVNVARELGARFVIAVDINFNRLGRQRRKPAAPEPAAASKAPSPGSDSVNPLMKLLREKLGEFDGKALASARRWIGGGDMPNVFDLLGNSRRIMEAQITESRLKIDPPNLLIRPDVGHLSFMDFNKAQESIQAGYDAAVKAIAKL